MRQMDQSLIQSPAEGGVQMDQTDISCRGSSGGIGLKKILVPVDFSPSSKDALNFAVLFAQQFGASLTILHVAVPRSPVDPYGSSLPDFLRTELIYQAQRQLDCLAGEVVPPGVLSQTLARQSHDRVAPEIVQAANELDTDLIIISTHGRTGLKRVVFGSTAEYVMRHALCPVFILRTKELKREE